MNKTKSIQIRIAEKELAELKAFAEFYGESLSEIMLAAVRERMELWEDLKDIQAYQKEKEKGTLETSTMQEIKERLGF